ncbi:hypothetical protein KP509_11G012400 [Ceratopteris richardii]|uniref:Helicase ATP-binding domain-containing protein n=1 Tax=Ceratopteris richardii TaxID=49495 RepID=A0A8T2TSX1_CERRI|nr:hypothetical protein KP509_11G012400 [Ceratopteris richardii]
MQASALSKSLEISWRALRKASITETIYPWRVLRLTAVSINLYAPVWSAHAGIAKQSRKASNKIFHVDEGTNECKFSREDQEILQKAIAYEAEHGFPNCVGRTKRFSEFLASKLVLPNVLPSHASKTLSLLFDMAQKYAEMDANSRVCLLDKVSAFLGFKSLQDLLDHHHAVIAGNDLDLNTRASEHSDKHPLVILQKNSHPAIVFGSSERLELFKYPESKGGQVGKSSEDGQVGKSSGAFPAKKKVSDSSRAASPVANGRKVKDISSEQKIRVPSNQSRRVKKTVKNVEGDGVYEDWLLNKPINLVKCLSSMACSQLENQGFYTLRKLLQHYPRNYLNFLQPREKIEDGQFLILSGRILSSRVRSAHGLGILQISIGLSAVSKGSDSDEKDSPTFHVTRFFRGARYSSNWFLKRLLEKYPAGAFCAVSGKVKVMEKKNNFEVKDYSLEVVDNADFHHTDLIYPIYSSRGGLSPKFFKLCIEKWVKSSVLLQPFSSSVLLSSEDCKTAYGLMDLREAYIGIHSPQNMMIAEEARKRFVFDEFFFLQLGLLQRRQAEATIMHNVVPTADGSELHAKTGYLPCEKWAPLTSRMYECLPYKLTNSQLKAISEIIWDLQRPIPMRRLLQGDVGCGKTVVGFLALLEVIDAGLQGVLMAPTEFLAKQHYERFCEILKHLEETQRPRIALLTGSVSSVKSQAVRKGLENGSIQLAVGTHSLISDEVRFASLGLVIVDEQHRFGVEQRLRLQNKVCMTV